MRRSFVAKLLPAGGSLDGNAYDGSAMPIITIKFPSYQEEERARRFQVHKQYLSAISEYLFATYRTPAETTQQGLLAAQNLPGFQRIQRQAPRKSKDIRRYLAIEWASETQLRMSLDTERSLLRYSNAWAPIHAYYACIYEQHEWTPSYSHRTTLGQRS